MAPMKGPNQKSQWSCHMPVTADAPNERAATIDEDTEERERGQYLSLKGLCGLSGMKLEGVRFCVCALCAFIVLPVFLCALYVRTGVDGAVVDADHAEVHQRH